MNKVKIIMIFFVILIAIIVLNISPDDQLEIHKEFEIGEGTLNATLSYKNNELLYFKPSPEDKYECIVTLEIQIDDFEQTSKTKILSQKNPIDINGLFVFPMYEDDNIIIFHSFARYHANGSKDDEQILRDLQSYVYVKKQKQYFAYESLYGDCIEFLKENGLSEYDEDKLHEIMLSTKESTKMMLEKLRSE